MPHSEERQLEVAEDIMELVQNYPLLKSFLAGSVSGTCSTLLFQPLDLIKTRLQINSRHRKGMISLLFQVLKNERLLGLWRGTIPSITRCVPGVGLYFSSLHWLQANFSHGELRPVEAVCFGVIGRSFTCATLLPVTVIKTRFESGVYQYKSLGQAIKIIYSTEGVKGLFSGIVPTLVRDAPFSGLYLMFYTQAKKAVPPSYKEKIPQAPCNFSCGVVAGVLASLVTQPADVLKTKMQLYPEKYQRVIVTTISIYKENGISGFFSGIVPRVMRRTLMSAMAWTVYEQIISLFGLK